MKPALIHKDDVQVQLKSAAATTAVDFLLKDGDGAKCPQPVNGTTDDAGTSTTLKLADVENLTVNGQSLAILQEIWNVTDGSHAVILSITANQVVTTPLRGGTNNVWGNGHEFSVNPFVLTVVRYSADGSSELQKEVVRFYKRSGNQLTTDANGRGIEGTTALEWGPDDYLELRNPALLFETIKEKVNYLRQLLEGVSTIPGLKTFEQLPRVTADPTNDDELTRKSWVMATILSSADPTAVLAALGTEGATAVKIKNSLELADPTELITLDDTVAGSFSASNFKVAYDYESSLGRTLPVESTEIATVINKEISIDFDIPAGIEFDDLNVYIKKDSDPFYLWQTLGLQLNSNEYPPIAPATATVDGATITAANKYSSGYNMNHAGTWLIAVIYVSNDGNEHGYPFYKQASTSVGNDYLGSFSVTKTGNGKLKVFGKKNGQNWKYMGQQTAATQAWDVWGSTVGASPYGTPPATDELVDYINGNANMYDADIVPLTNGLIRREDVSLVYENEALTTSTSPATVNETVGKYIKYRNELPETGDMVWAENGKQPSGAIYMGVGATINSKLCRLYFVPQT